MKPSTLKTVLPELIAMRRPPFIWGKSGIGKSSVVRQVAAAMGLQLNDMRLSQLDSIDLRGFPVPDMKKRRMDWLPCPDLPTNDDPPGMLFLDECNGAMPTVASAAYQLILDGRIGQYILPQHWSIVAAGNNMGDRGITHQMPAPLNNRFIHIDMEVDHDDWHHQAAADGLSVEIRAYMRLKKESLHDFDPVLNPRSFPTPRAWYFVDEVFKRENLKNKPLALLELIKGTVGEGHGASFTGFCRDLASMPDIDSIMMNPKQAKLPGNQSVMHAVGTALADRTTPTNFDRVMVYMERLEPEIQTVFVRSAVNKDDRVCNTKTYQDWVLKNQDFLK